MWPNQNGEYQLKLHDNRDGAVVGTHRVTISAIPGMVVANDGKAHAEPAPGKNVDRVPAKYNTKTELTKEVPSGGATFDFELKSK